MIVAPRSTSARLALSAAGFIATSTLGASPGVRMSLEAKWIWKAETQASVPAGARISAGKFGNVARSLPSTAVASVNRLPASCMPSPESPANRMTTRSRSSTVLLMRSVPLTGTVTHLRIVRKHADGISAVARRPEWIGMRRSASVVHRRKAGADYGAARGVNCRVESMSPPRATWLCPDDQARARVLENSRRVRRARTIASSAVGLAVIYSAPRYSWWLVPMFVFSLVNTSTVEVRMRRARHPEYHAAFAVFLSQALIAAAAAISGGPRSPMLSLMAVPTGFAATRFRPAVCFAAAVSGVALVLLASLGLSPSETVADPTAVLVALVLVVGVSASTHALFDAELQHRNEAILDPLTGVLNRHGLEQRFHELAEQARLTGAPISLLICDLDHFKHINDAYGHATGDAVLRDAALALRRQLRSFELIYRLG